MSEQMTAKVDVDLAQPSILVAPQPAVATSCSWPASPCS